MSECALNTLPSSAAQADTAAASLEVSERNEWEELEELLNLMATPTVVAFELILV